MTKKSRLHPKRTTLGSEDEADKEVCPKFWVCLHYWHYFHTRLQVLRHRENRRVSEHQDWSVHRW